jgi:intracellular multiplication protein IcmP
MQSRSNQEATGAELLYVVGGVLAVLAFLYYVFHAEVVHGLFMLKYYELLLISHFSPSYEGLIGWIQQTSTGTVTYEDLKYLAIVVGEPLKYACAIVLLLMAVVLYMFHPEATFRGFEDMQSLANKMKSTFPAVEMVSDLDLCKQPLDKGPWAMALTPIEFAKQHKLLYRDEETQRIMVKRELAKTVFTEQLGPLWPGVKSLQGHEKAIFAALALYVNYQRDRADALLEQISRSANTQAITTGKFNYRGVDEVIKEYGDSPAVQALVDRHAHKHVVFTAMLHTARLTGIVANSSYLWIKPIDRKLWYVLNNVGRKAVYIETAAIHAQYLAERQLGYPIRTPILDSPIDGLQEAVDGRIIRDLT